MRNNPLVLLLPSSVVHSAPRKETTRKLDHLSIFLLVAGLVLFLLGISWGGEPYPWGSGLVLGLLISEAVTSAAFVLYELYRNVTSPIIPMCFFKDIPGFGCVVIISGCLNTAVFVVWSPQVTYIFGSAVSNWQPSVWMSAVVNFAS